MDELLSVGLDVGTTSTQLVVSKIRVENRANGFCVPEMDITEREIVYESQVSFTPLVGENLVDGEKIAKFVEEEYKKAEIKPNQVDTGAVIVTGETSRKENAAAVLESLSGLAGDFVVATAGPDLESILAAKGAGATAYSERTGEDVLHMDIGGGTANLCYIREGQVVATGCLNVGGRLVKVEDGKITYVSTVLRQITDEQCSPLQIGDVADVDRLEKLAEVLVQGLEMAGGLREKTHLWDVLWTKECGLPSSPPERPWLVSFSGGVADCIEKELPPFLYGDMGPILGKAIRESLLCKGKYRLGEQTIRATVIGAGCHSAQLSGSTVFCRNIALPLKNLPVVHLAQQEDAAAIARQLGAEESPVLALPGYVGATYEQVSSLAEVIIEGFGDRQIIVCLEQDMAKALGQRIFLLSGKPCLCIDRIRLRQGSFLDVGQPVGPCFPVVVKTLIFNN